MSTGVETWNTNLLEIGPLYPFVGTEMALVVVGAGAWIVWHIVQVKIEAREIERESKFADSQTLQQALDREES